MRLFAVTAGAVVLCARLVSTPQVLGTIAPRPIELSASIAKIEQEDGNLGELILDRLAFHNQGGSANRRLWLAVIENAIEEWNARSDEAQPS